MSALITRRKFGKLCSAALLVSRRKPDLSRMHGRIQWVKAFPDYRVKVVSAFEDLSVQVVKSGASRSGQWQIVNHFPDYKLQRVDAFPDFTIKYVTHFPGPKSR